MMESNRVKNRPEKLSAIKLFLEKMDPIEVDFIKYQHGKRQGAAWHDDAYAVFGTVIIVLKDSPVGRLHIEDVDVPECLQPGDVVVIDPIRVHQVASAIRADDRVTATIVF